jgi:hypothetical protein
MPIAKVIYTTTDGKEHDSWRKAIDAQLELSCTLSMYARRRIAHYHHGVAVNVVNLCFHLEIKRSYRYE